MSEAVLSHEARLAELGLDLPELPRPTGLYVPFRHQGDTVYLAGQTCEWNGRMIYSGKVGIDLDLETAQDAARICGLNLIAALRLALGGSLDRVEACVRLGGFVERRAGLRQGARGHQWRVRSDGPHLRARGCPACPHGHRGRHLAAMRGGRGGRHIRGALSQCEGKRWTADVL